MDELKVREIIEGTLSAARFKHVSGVVKAAEQLAVCFGVDPVKARLAAWTHDYAREWPVDKWYEVAQERGVDPAFFEAAELLHGPIAATLLQEVFAIDDEDIANAVRYHTSGRVGMSRLEKVVCLADYIEEGRNYPGVDNLRKLAERDLNLALATAFDGTIRLLLDKHKSIFPLTILCRNELWREVIDGPAL